MGLGITRKDNFNCVPPTNIKLRIFAELKKINEPATSKLSAAV
jgi:hypothetical protein